MWTISSNVTRTAVVDCAAEQAGAPPPECQLSGTSPRRAAAAVTKDAYDLAPGDQKIAEEARETGTHQVRSAAESGLPVARLNCSARAPSSGVYFSTIAKLEMK